MSLREWLFGAEDEDDETPPLPLYDDLSPEECRMSISDGTFRAYVSAEDWFGDDQTAVTAEPRFDDGIKLILRARVDEGGSGCAIAGLDADTARDLAAELTAAAEDVDDIAADDGGDGE